MSSVSIRVDEGAKGDDAADLLDGISLGSTSLYAQPERSAGNPKPALDTFTSSSVDPGQSAHGSPGQVASRLVEEVEEVSDFFVVPVHDTPQEDAPDQEEPPDDGSLSSDSEGETEGQGKGKHDSTMKRSHMPDGTSSQKTGYLLKYNNFVKGWSTRHLSLVDGTLFYAKHESDCVRVEVDVRFCSVAERGDKNLNNGFEVITEQKKLVLQASTRAEMEAWMTAFKRAAVSIPLSRQQLLQNEHSLFVHRPSRVTFCNVCAKRLAPQKKCLRCEVCGFRAHAQCAAATATLCKWTTCLTVPHQCRTDDGVIGHQWITGNMPGSSKCAVCTKAVGSTRRLQDFRCMWCRTVVHSFCRVAIPAQCTLGRHRVSILQPTGIEPTKAKESSSVIAAPSPWQVNLPPNSSPLVIFINPKSGSNDGVAMGRVFRNLLNPAQVFDLSQGGPSPGLRLLKEASSFRALACGGDGTVGWVLQEADKLGIQQMQLGVLPLGTGNDLGQVLGWGASFGDTDKLSDFIDSVEKAKVVLLDRWRVSSSPLLLGQMAKKESDKKGRKKGRRSSSGSIDEPELGGGAEGGKGAPASDRSFDKQKLALGTSGHLRVASTRRSNPLATIKASEGSDLAAGGSLPSTQEDAGGGDVSGTDDGPMGFSEFPDVFMDEAPGEPTFSVSPGPDTSLEEWASTRASLGSFHSSETARAADGSDSPDKVASKRAEKERRDTPGGLIRQDVDDIRNDLDRVMHTGTEFKALAAFLAIRATAPIPVMADELPSLADKFLHDCGLLLEALLRGKTFTHDSHSRMTAACEACSRLSLEVAGVCKAWEGGGQGPALVKRLQVLEDDVSVLTGTVSSVVAAHEPSVASMARVRSSLDSCHTGEEQGQEISVMNNYFGIGLDAKIAFDFDTLRREHPEKCRSRVKNQMWYGYLGVKQTLVNDYKNLHKRISLEVDGEAMDVPKCQGVVVMNIPSYMGGVNLWGSPSERKYPPQAMDDGLLEVIILKNSAEMAISKGSKGNITPTRLCQARDLKIILHQGDPIPIQVDGEAWMQQPCVLSVTHKGRAQMLSRDKGFQKMLLKWPAAKPGSSSQSNDILSKFDVAVTSLLGIADKVAQSVESVAAALQKLLQAVRDNRDTIFDKKGCRKPAFSRSKVVLYVHNAVVLTETLQLQFNLARQRPPFLVTPTDVEGLGAAALGPLAKALDLASAACEHQTRRMMAFVDEGAIKGIRKGSVMSRFKRRLSSLSAKRLSAAEDSSRAASPLASPQGSPRTSPRASPSSGRVVPAAKLDTLRPPGGHGQGAGGFRFSGSEEDVSKLDGRRFFSGSGADASAGGERPSPRARPTDLLSWLRANEMGELAPAFKEEGVTLASLPDLGSTELTRLGLTTPGEQRAFARAVHVLVNDQELEPGSYA